MSMRILLLALSTLLIMSGGPLQAAGGEKPQDITYTTHPPAPLAQTADQVAAKSKGCLSCHTITDSANMHSSPSANIGCTDCHGGDAKVFFGPLKKAEAKKLAHVQPLFPQSWNHPKSANPIRSYTLLNRESPEYIRFVNPSDLRVAREACGACHLSIVQAVERSLMSTGAMLWGGAAYNNGILPFKNYITGEGYTREGVPAKLIAPVKPTEKMLKKGILPFLLPMPALIQRRRAGAHRLNQGVAQRTRRTEPKAVQDGGQKRRGTFVTDRKREAMPVGSSFSALIKQPAI